MTGRSRLQPGVKQYVSLSNRGGDGLVFPVGHTCGNSMDFYITDSKENMKKALLIAIRLCGEIDDDGEYLSGEDSEYAEDNTL